jgi:integrase
MRTKIRQRSGRWYVSVVDDAGLEQGHGGYRTKRDASAAAAALLTDAARGRYVAPGKLTVAGYLLGEWLPSRETADISPNSRDVEAIIVRAWIVPHLGEIQLQKLTARDLDRLYLTLRQRGGRDGRPLRGKSVRNAHALLSKALKDAVRRGHLAVNPVLDPPARDDSVDRIAWTRAETRAFLAVASDDRLGAIWRLALATGARRGELLGATWDNLDGSSLAIRRQVLVRPGGGPGRVYIRETTKSRRVRRVRFDETTAAALRKWKAVQAEERIAFGPAWKTDGGLGVDADWMVTESDGGVIHPDTLRARWRRLARAAGVPEIPLHAARHTYAELALAAGIRLDVVSRQLGHASIATTGNIYTHDGDEAAAEAAQRVGEILEGGSA